MAGPRSYALNVLYDNDIVMAKLMGNLRPDFPDKEVVLDYIDIFPEAEHEIKEFLIEKDITHKSLFPDLSGLVEHINNIYPSLVRK